MLSQLNVCLMAHPGPQNAHGPGNTGTAGQRAIARTAIVADFTGKPAHAGGNPWDSINALDALVSSYNNVAMLRQQMYPSQRIHACIIDSPVSLSVHTTHSWCELMICSESRKYYTSSYSSTICYKKSDFSRCTITTKAHYRLP